ncbi:MAG: polyphosphate glucokinase [Bacteroidetes bacterium GWA2_31_9]|nr:MAG: polyphosphate glucokinase [Bacteroidetes bacterium GWA2_31_9]
MQILGVDIGGSGIKGAIVDVKNGLMLTERHRIETPQPATIEGIAKTLVDLVNHFNWKGKIGCGFPSVVINGCVKTAANIDKKWINIDAQKVFSEATKCEVTLVNDADAAGIAEVQFGIGKGMNGVVLLLTFGTGIGSALFTDGKLVPNTEFGHVLFHGDIAEKYVAASVRKNQELSWGIWGKRLNEYLLHMEKITNPELIIIGGGISKKFEKYSQFISLKTKVVNATLFNNAGIIGAALSVK